MLDMQSAWWELVVRVAVIYTGLLVLVRLTGKRTLSTLAPMELLTILLVSETVSPSLTGEDTSLPAGLIAAGTLFALTLGLTVATYRFRWIERVVEGSTTRIVRDGEVDLQAMARERISVEELKAAMRTNGIDSIDKVRLATVERDGEISFLGESRAKKA